MKYSSLLLPSLVICGLFLSSNTVALTMSDFVTICKTTDKPCAEYPVLQAYVGGALDLIATLDEETEYLQKIYCKPPNDLFDVSKIIEFMESHRVEYANNNSMILVIRYLEENGGC